MVLPCVLAALLGACGPKPPSDSFQANLDANCQPHDPVDKLRALVSPNKFWLEAEQDMEAFVKAGVANMKTSGEFYETNRTGRGQFESKVRSKAAELGYDAARTQAMVRDNLRDFDRSTASYSANLKAQQIELAWARKCLGEVQRRIAQLRIPAGEREAAKLSSKRKLKITVEDLVSVGLQTGFTREELIRIGRESTLTRQQLQQAMMRGKVPVDVQDEVMRGLDAAPR